MRPTNLYALRAILGIVGFLWALYGAKHALLGRSGVAVGFGVLAVVTAISLLAILRKPALSPVLGRAILGLTLTAIAGNAWLSGQGHAGGIWFLPIVPVMVATAFPQDDERIWGGAALLLLIGIWAGTAWLPFEPLFEVRPSEHLMSQLTILATLTWSLGIYRKRLEQDLSLEAERTAAIEQQKQEAAERARDLAQTTRQLEDALKAREAFLAQMSHEVRTPLNGILGLAQLMADPNTPLSRIQMARDISASGRTLLTLLNNILDVSKLRSGAFELSMRRFDLHEQVESSLQIFAGDAWARHVDLAYLYDFSVPRVVVSDPVRLSQVLNNLLGNAIRHTEHGTVTVRAHHDDTTQRLHLDVDDSGPGVPEDQRARLFQAFEQGVPYADVGTGLGLALVKEILDRMDGTVTIGESPEGGARFHIEVPVRVVEFGLTIPPGVPRRVLLAEPHALSAQALACRMYALGVTVIQPASTKALSELWAAQDFDLAILCPRTAEEHGLLDDRALRPVLAVHRRPDTTTLHHPTVVGRIDAPFRTRSLGAALRNALIDGEDSTDSGHTLDFGARIPQRILVAEDDPTSRQVLGLLLRRMGFEPDIVTDGAEAVEQARSQDYDTVLLDRQMPNLDGVEAARRIRALLPEARIAIISASVSADQQAELASFGVRDVLQKPISLAELTVVLERSGPTTLDEPADTEPPEPGLDAAPPDEVRRAVDRLRTLLRDSGAVDRMVLEWTGWIRPKLAEAAVAARAGDLTTVEAHAHAFAGSCSQFGGTELEGQARALMAWCELDRSRALAQTEPFVEQATAFCDALDRFVGQP